MTSVLPMPLHFGGLHPYETALVGLLAFGPFVVLAFVVVVIRRRDAAAVDEAEGEATSGSEGSQKRRTEG